MADIILERNQQIPRDTRLRLYHDNGDGTHTPATVSITTGGEELAPLLRAMTAALALLAPPTTPGLAFLLIAGDNEEFSMEFEERVRRLAISNRDGNAFRLSFFPGYVATSSEPYLEIPAGGAYDSGAIDWTGAIYVAGTANDEIQIEYWY